MFVALLKAMPKAGNNQEKQKKQSVQPQYLEAASPNLNMGQWQLSKVGCRENINF
jgi:hypothetical protein